MDFFLGLGSACHGLRPRKLEHGDPMRSYHGLHVPLYLTGAFRVPARATLRAPLGDPFKGSGVGSLKGAV